MFIKHIRNYYSPDDSGGSLGELPGLDDVGILEDGNNDDNTGSEDGSTDDDELPDEDSGTGENKGKSDKEKEDDSEEADEDKDDEESEEEDSDDKEDEPKDEITSADGKISVKALREQYPDIFKKNPGLKDVIFREREYSKHFGTVEDAQEAAVKSQSFDNFEETLLNGDIGNLLDSVANVDDSAAVKIAQNFLPELLKRSQHVYAEVTAPVIKNILRHTFVRAQNQGNKNLTLAVQYLSRELFETPDVIKATEVEDIAENPQAKELERKKAEFSHKQNEAASNDIVSNVKNRLAKDIHARLGSEMSDFVKDALTDKITNELDRSLMADKAHMAQMSSLWKKLSKSGFSTEAKNRIISAALSRARVLLPTVITKVKAQQKGGDKNGKRIVVKAGDKQVPNQNKSNNKQGRSTGKLDRTMSDYDFLNQ